MNILEELKSLKREHYYCEDRWYSCPRYPEGCADENAGLECNCDAERYNARIDVIISEYIKLGELIQNFPSYMR